MTSPPHVLIFKKIQSMFSSRSDINQKNIICELKPPRMNIRMNRPKRYNAFTLDMYLTITELLNKSADMDDIKYIVISGEGGNFSSGNDLTNFSNPKIAQLGDFPDIVKASALILSEFTQSIIKCRKPLFALTQGKVIGVCFTQLPLFDKVFATESCQFFAPLVSSAQGPQMCSSYTFPRIFGMRVAEQLITFSKKVNSDFLQKYNLVQKCKSREDAEQKLQSHLKRIDDLQWQSFINARRLYRERGQEILLKISKRETENLIQRWQNPELMSYLAKHMTNMKKSKL